VIRGRLIVCLASAWDYDPTSKHHLMRVLSRENRILWINYHGTRKPKATRADLSAAWSALGRFGRGVTRVDSCISQCTPLVMPGATRSFWRKVHRAALTVQIRRAIQVMQPDEPLPIQVWSFAPDVPYLVGRFNEECFVYYCVDDYRRFEDMNRTVLESAEDELLDRADLVVTTSDALLDAKRARRPDAVLIRHGVNYEHFAAAWRSFLPEPADLAGIPKPRLGFFGLIHHWVDCDLLAETAAMRPQYSFVLIGDCRKDAGRLRSMPNVFLPGRRPYEMLPAYCAAFEAGLLPFVQNEMVRSINPIKMYEYLAAGLPIVSTPLPEAERFAGPIRIRSTAAEFAAACDEVVNGPFPVRRESISELVRKESWESKVEELSEIVMSKVQHRAYSCGECVHQDHDHPKRTREGAPSSSRVPAIVPGSAG